MTASGIELSDVRSNSVNEDTLKHILVPFTIMGMVILSPHSTLMAYFVEVYKTMIEPLAII